MEEGPSASECPVCFVQLGSQRVPMSMPCGHTVCKCCIDQLGESAATGPPDRKPSFPCPLCRQWVAIDSVTVNVTLRDLLEELRRPQPRAGGGVGTALNIAYGDIKFTEMLDRGAFGEVHRAYWQGYEVAVKVFTSGKLTAEALEAFQREVLVMNSLRHPNVVLLMGACQTPPRLCIVMEFVGGGSLHNLIHIDRVAMALSDVQQVSLCTCRGLQYLHSINIMHRDLKSKNVLLTGPLPCQAKLCDFGLARLRQENATMTGNVGTVHWTAPEIMVNKRYQFPADVYSFGMVLYEMAVGRIPFHNMIPMGVMMAVAIQKQRPPMTPGVDPKLADLIERCTRWEPEERPCVGAVLQSLLDLLPLVERTKGHASSAQLELNHTNSLGYVFVLASQVGTSNPSQGSKEIDMMDGLKKEVKEVTSPLPDPTPLTYKTSPPPVTSDTTDLQLALKLQKEEDEARRLQLESDEQLAEQLQNKENTFVVPVEDVPSMKGPPPQLLKTIKSGTHVLKRTQSPRALKSTISDHQKEESAPAMPTSRPPPPPPPPPPPVYGRVKALPTTAQRVMASIRTKAAQLGKHLRPVTTVEKRAFKVGRVVDEEDVHPPLTMQYEITHFEKSWLNQVEFREPEPLVPLGKVRNDKGYPLRGMVHSLTKLWKSDPKKKSSPPAQRKHSGDEEAVQELRGLNTSWPSLPMAYEGNEGEKPSGSGAKKNSSAQKPSKPSMEKRSISGNAIRSNQASAASHQGLRSVSYPNSLQGAKVELDSSNETETVMDRSSIRKGVSAKPSHAKQELQKVNVPVMTASESFAEQDTLNAMEALTMDSRSMSSEVSSDEVEVPMVVSKAAVPPSSEALAGAEGTEERTSEAPAGQEEKWTQEKRAEVPTGEEEEETEVSTDEEETEVPTGEEETEVSTGEEETEVPTGEEEAEVPAGEEEKEVTSEISRAEGSKLQSKKVVTKKLATFSKESKPSSPPTKQALKHPMKKAVVSHNNAYFYPTKMAASESHNPLYKSPVYSSLNDKFSTATAAEAPRKVKTGFRKGK